MSRLDCRGYERPDAIAPPATMQGTAARLIEYFVVRTSACDMAKLNSASH